MRHDGSIPGKGVAVLIRGIWESQTEAIIDVRFGDSEADTYKKEGMGTIFLGEGK